MARKNVVFVFENDSATVGCSERLRDEIPLGATIDTYTGTGAGVGKTWKALRFGKNGKGFEIKSGFGSMECAIYWIRRRDEDDERKLQGKIKNSD